MARPRKAQPSYLLHKSSGLARVRINGHDVYLGAYNSPESWQKYHELLARNPTPESRVNVTDEADSETVAELVARYVEHADSWYSHNPDEKYRIKAAITPLIEQCGSIAVASFSPKQLKAVRQSLVVRGNARTGKPLTRKYVNQLTAVIVRIFKWGVAEEIVPVTVYQTLTTVGRLRKGRTANLKESTRIKPVPEEDIPAVIKVVSSEVASMIQLQLLTGMRPDEVTIMRPVDIQKDGEIWVYTIASRFDDSSGDRGSKTDYLENVDAKEILLGPQAQSVLKPWIERREPDQYLFDPREVAARHSCVSGVRDHYNDESYCQAVQRGCRRAGVSVWTPGRLRHNAATRIRRDFNTEAARLVLGHRHLSTTEIYAERDRELYESIVKSTG